MDFRVVQAARKIHKKKKEAKYIQRTQRRELGALIFEAAPNVRIENERWEFFPLNVETVMARSPTVGNNQN